MKDGKNDVNKFWAAYRRTVIKCGVSQPDADWYVKWCEKFALSIKGKPLRKRTGDDVIAF